ncbi:MAG: carotenoid biosynthesis protein [Chitinophagales bacterium]|nr:carotenoid biosynthesis protein [Chitinophagales bacterium]MDW8392784.1 carotenoid biosynthesis protein [Chitinophagales bacterium]
MERKKAYLIGAARGFVVLYYAVGLCGLIFYPEVFRHLVALSLVITATLLFVFHQPWNLSYQLYALSVMGITWLMEWIGVETGAIFGVYRYGDHLGLKLAGVPLLIGVNWLMLLYCCGMLVEVLKIQPPWRALSGAALMVAIDLLLEPVAVKLDWWYWQTGAAPLQNYVAWFYLSFLLLLPYFRIRQRPYNPLAIWIAAAHVIFFIVLNIV